jgi:hypothetical protein
VLVNVFVDPTSFHIIVISANGESYYVNMEFDKKQNPLHLSKLKVNFSSLNQGNCY